jgi:hypothetical protein
MSAILTVPSGYVTHLRGGLIGELGNVGETVAGVASWRGTKAHAEFADLRESFEAVCALLDATGWEEDASQGDVALDLAAHPTIVLSALRHEHDEMTGRVEGLPKKTSKAVRERAAAKAAAFEDFVKAVEAQVARLPAGRRRGPAGASRLPRR